VPPTIEIKAATVNPMPNGMIDAAAKAVRDHEKDAEDAKQQASGLPP
jgi:hypothetical protein